MTYEFHIKRRGGQVGTITVTFDAAAARMCLPESFLVDRPDPVQEILGDVVESLLPDDGEIAHSRVLHGDGS